MQIEFYRQQQGGWQWRVWDSAGNRVSHRCEQPSASKDACQAAITEYIEADDTRKYFPVVQLTS